MKSVQDAHAGSFHTELSGHTEIPLKFKEDGSFKGEAPMPVTQAGYMHAGNTDCKMSGNIAMKMEVEGTVDDAKPVLHLVVSNGTTGGPSSMMAR